ncbi:MAG: epoxyqueuosine reductase QueH [Tenericutes bacterium]|nr:epoxyqueuosine reductase QueH [Mycoplasmatota bacterium]
MNYNKVTEEIIENLNKKPSILIHSCCGPCSSYVLEYLSKYFNITIYYYNPNIDSEEEYTKRLNEQVKIINLLSKKSDIKLIEGKYEPQKYYEYIKGLENEKEGNRRCIKCYNLRLEQTALVAKELNFDYFCTTLTISPHKDAKIINFLGKRLENKYDVSYLYSDFKKKNGYKRSIELSKEYDLYRQDYCGCIFSKKEYD